MIIFWSSVLAACSQTLNLYFMSCFLDFSLAHFFDWTWVYSMCCSLGFLGARFSVAHLFDWNRNLQVLFIANTSEAICESVLLQFRDEFLRKFKTKCSCSDSSSKKLSNPSWFWFFSSLSCLWFSSAACPRVVPSQWWCTARRRRHRFADALGPLDFWIQWLILSSKLSPSNRSSSFGFSCLLLPCLCNAWSVTSRMCGYSPEWKGGAFQSLPRTFDWDETESYPASCHKVGSAGGGSMRLLSNFQNSYKKVRFSDMCPSPLTSKSFFIWLSMCFGSTCFWTLKGPCFKRFSFRI